VVAADKGTAHLSNTANAISAEYGFWLGDAFASGGSQGYDHKALGITARGAWICVQRHFLEMGKDIQQEPFTVIGIGDMSGDVFGNGMLLSRQIRLLAAFDHRHIFLDPDPDPASSFAERQRLFRLPRSSWDDYDRALLSAGGGVFPRRDKDIQLSVQVRNWLGIRREVVDGEELVRLLLAAEADLLWNGGIGTYVRASSEKDEEVGDRANDAVRIEAGQLRVRVVGEGGNLGLTQKARIEFALAGGRIDTDAVHNSAGVDCSDHEVNLKILMQHLAAKGLLAEGERDRLLAEVTDDVCHAVLANNAGQSLCLSLDQRRSSNDFEPYLDLIERLGSAGLLDRRGESLPTLKEILARPDRRLTRPELAVLMAYSKMHHCQLLLESDLVLNPAVQQILYDYFPPQIRERFAPHLGEHPLAQAICATMLSNLLVNQAGSAFLNPLSRQMGAPPAKVVAAYLVFDLVLEGAALRREIGRVGQRSGAEREYALLLQLEEVLAALCKWGLKHGMQLALQEERIAALRGELTSYRKILGSILAPAQWQQLQEAVGRLQEEGLETEWAQRIAALPYLEDLLPSVALAGHAGVDLHSVARTFNEVRQQLDMEAVLRQFAGVQLRDRWDRMAAQMLKEAFAAAAFRISQAVWQECSGNLESFFGRRRQQLTFYRALRENLRGVTPANYHPLTVLVRALEDLLSRGETP
jgi:glutamate dehydrogenase